MTVKDGPIAERPHNPQRVNYRWRERSLSRFGPRHAAVRLLALGISSQTVEEPAGRYDLRALPDSGES